MILKYLRLRGAKGIKRRLGTDEVNIDFSQFEPGLIVICGPNGAGKTTIVENLTPYPSLFSRKGALYNQFCLKDSARELHVEIDGHEYKFLLNINAESKKMECYVYRDGVCLNEDGKQKSYSEKVTEIVGSEDLFFRSLFMPQKRIPFSQVEPVKRKELLLELIGQGELQAKVEFAAAKAKALKTEVASLSGRRDQLQETLSDLEGIEELIEMRQSELTTLIGSKTEIAESIDRLTTEIDNLQKQVTEQAVTKSKIDDGKRRLSQLKRDKEKMQLDALAENERLTSKISAEQSRVEQFEKLARPEHLEKLKTRLEELQALKHEIKSLQAKESRYDELTHELKLSKSDSDRLIDAKKLALKNKRADLARVERDAHLLEEVPCQDLPEPTAETCRSCPLLVNATKASSSIPELKRSIDTISSEIEGYRSDYSTTVSRLETEISELQFDPERYEKIRVRVSHLEAGDIPAQIARAESASETVQTAKENLAELREQVAKLNATTNEKAEDYDSQIQSLEYEIDQLEASFDSTLESNLAAKRSDLGAKRKQLESLSEQISSQKASIEKCKEDLEKRDQAKEKLTEIKSQIGSFEADIADWEDLGQKLSRNGGFQSLMIESAGAELTTLANELLKNFDQNCSLEIATVRPSADGKSQVEGFFVNVVTPVGTQELSEVSGGEEVWYEAVLRYAIGMLVKKRFGSRLQTSILDEADGALDADRAIAYLKAIQEAHQHNGLATTIIISHRQEIQEMIPQRIRLVPEKGVEIEAA